MYSQKTLLHKNGCNSQNISNFEKSSWDNIFECISLRNMQKNQNRKTQISKVETPLKAFFIADLSNKNYKFLFVKIVNFYLLSYFLKKTLKVASA